MITVNLYRDGARVQSDIALDRFSHALPDEDEVLWLDVQDPSIDELKLIGEEFDFHPLALEDAHKQGQRPKVDFYDGYVFVVFYTLSFQEQRLTSDEIHMFIGRHYLVTLHSGTCRAISDVRARWQPNREESGHRGVSMLVYTLLDGIVDDYFPLLDDVSDRIELLEDRIFDRFDREAQQEIFQIKKDLLAVRRVIGPQRDVLNILLRRDSPVVDPGTIVYFQDIYDHVLRLVDAIDTYRDLLTSALDAYLSVTSNRLNQVMKTLTASSIILMSMTLVASIYGMNFDRMPELSWSFGYPLALGMMAVIGSIMFAIFRRINWL